MSAACPVCTAETVRIIGDEQADILLVGSIPNEEELKYHKPFSGSIGQIFRRELFKHADIDISNCRLAMLWYHENNKNEDCLSVSADLVMQEMTTDRRYVILVGAQAVTYFTNLSVDKVNGLEVTEYIVNPNISDTKYFALVNPSAVFARGIGELRFGLQSIKKEMEK